MFIFVEIVIFKYYYFAMIMKSRLLELFVLLFVSYNAFGSYFVSNLDYSATGSIVEIKWYQPENFTNAYLYYNIYFSSTQPRYTNGYFENFLDFNLIGVVEYSTNRLKKFVFTNHQNGYYYLVLPVTNGFFVLEDFYSLVVPKMVSISTPNQSNLTVFQASQNNNVISNRFVDSSQPIGITIDSLPDTSLSSISEDFEYKLRRVLSDYFFKGRYKISLDKLILLRDEASNEKEISLVDLYIARCYYAIGKKRKAMRILLQISDLEIRDIAEFWLNRFARYF